MTSVFKNKVSGIQSQNAAILGASALIIRRSSGLIRPTSVQELSACRTAPVFSYRTRRAWKRPVQDGLPAIFPRNNEPTKTFPHETSFTHFWRPLTTTAAAQKATTANSPCGSQPRSAAPNSWSSPRATGLSRARFGRQATPPLARRRINSAMRTTSAALPAGDVCRRRHFGVERIRVRAAGVAGTRRRSTSTHATEYAIDPAPPHLPKAIPASVYRRTFRTVPEAYGRDAGST